MTRQTRSLTGPWSFWTDATGKSTLKNFDAAKARKVPVPGPWQQHPDLRGYMGVGWYQRAFTLTAKARAGRALLLHFGAVDHDATVWVNGKKAGAHSGGYLPFDLDVTKLVKDGANTLVVRVEDALASFPEVPHGKQSWYGPISGIWQDVTLELRAPLHITALRLSPHDAQIDVSLTLSRAARGTVRMTVFDPQGAPVTTGLHEISGAAALNRSLPVKNPVLWDVDAPNLYTVRAELEDDALEDTCGFRTFETRAGQFLLNGRPFYMRSALDQDYYPDNTYTPPSLEYIEAQFRQAKAMGLNSLRIHIKVGDPRYYIAADRVGLVIWTELPNWQLMTARSQAIAREVFIGMHERDWNRPSIVIRSIINEAWGVEMHNPEHRQWMSDTYDWLKALDPTRLVVDNSACQGNFHVVSDIDDMHVYYSMPDHHRNFAEWAKDLAGRPRWTYAPKLAGEAERQRFMKDHWHANWIEPAAGVRRRGDEPIVVSEFGNWGLPDIGALRKHYGGDPWWFDTGLQWGSGEVYPHGVDERFDMYHLGRAFPNLKALTDASQQSEYQALKWELEEMRRHAPIQGYVITEFTDLHWECNGLLDMARNSKNFLKKFADINADDVILPECARTAVWEGEQVRVRLDVSQYSARDLSASELRWSLPGTSLKGVVSLVTPKQGDVVPAGELVFEAPVVAGNRQLELQFELVKNGKVMARNHLTLTLFKRASAAAPAMRVYAPDHGAALKALGFTLVGSAAEADVVVIATLTDAWRDYLLAGGKVLWLAETDDAQQAHWGGYHPVQIGPRRGTAWSGDWASNFNWLNQDVMFKDIPTGGRVDFAFADITPDHVIHGMHPFHFANDVHAGLFLGWIHKAVALVARRGVGRGTLLTSTFRLRAQLATHPIAAIMVRDMVRALG